MPLWQLIKAMLWVHSGYVLSVVGAIAVMAVYNLLGPEDLVDWVRATAVAGVA